ncbi:hypothetical protein F4861DRAFT_507919 [Xylaria intraflava]|nr:hypothetical protein F4861DRAFT_507919 [Xylaria intraflava]
MATQGPINTNNMNKTKSGGFPARLKSLIRSIRPWSKDSRRHQQDVRNEETPASKQQLPSEELIPTTREDIPVSDTRSSFHTPHVRSLSVRVTVSFGEPLNYSNTQDYEASSSLQPTEELCEALLRRVDHCSKELITRRDSSALDRTDPDGKAKPLRYEIQAQVLRNEIGTGTEAWASRTLRSYQRQPVSTSAAREVILSTHYMVGLFLRHHDAAFVWKDGPVREDPSQELKAFQYRPGRVQPLTSIPRSYFIEKQQDFESIPGYTIRLAITSQNHHRTPSQWRETVEIHSHQLSPLTFASAESLFLDACYAVDGVFKHERKGFAALQEPCANHSGCDHCRPHEGDGVEIDLSLNNNVGPLFDNLRRTTRANINLFRKDRATDCTEFFETAKAAIEQVRREADGSISRVNDFEFYIIELQGQGWTIDEPLAFRLGPETCLDRRTIEALLDRLQTGVADILRGNAIAVQMMARKRGHLIMHKTLVTREPMEKPGRKRRSPRKSKTYVLDRLGQRIKHDIDMVCKDTCSIVNREAETVKVNSVTSPPSQEYGSTSTSIPSRKISDLAIPSATPANNEQDSSVDRPSSRRSESSESPESLSTPSSDRRRRWTRVTRDNTTGVRLFPLLPDDLAASEPNTRSSHELAAHNNNFMRDNTTETSFDLTMSQGKTNTLLTQTTENSVASTRGKETPNTSLADSHNDERDWYTTEESSVSTRPGTPSLEAEGGPSVRSIAVAKEKAPKSVINHEVENPHKSTPSVASSDGDATGQVESYLRRLYARQPASPIARPLSRLSFASSRMSEARPLQKELIPVSGTEDISAHKAERSSQSGSENVVQTTDSENAIRIVNTVPAELAAEKDAPSEGNNPPQESEPERDPFSQSKPDFDFSASDTEDNETTKEPSPITETHPSPNPSLEKQTKDREPTPSETSDAPARQTLPVLPQQRLSLRSFGSTNYLGSLHDQGLYSVGLRRSVLGTSTPPRPFTPVSIREMEIIGRREAERPGTPSS